MRSSFLTLADKCLFDIGPTLPSLKLPVSGGAGVYRLSERNSAAAAGLLHLSPQSTHPLFSGFPSVWRPWDTSNHACDC